MGELCPQCYAWVGSTKFRLNILDDSQQFFVVNMINRGQHLTVLQFDEEGLLLDKANFEVHIIDT